MMADAPAGTSAPPTRRELEVAIDTFVDAHRDRCLWFLRRDYHPGSDPERLHVLTEIQRRGDRETFVRAGLLKRWLSRLSSDASAGS